MSDLAVSLSVTTPDIATIVGDYTDTDGNAKVVSYDPGGVVRRRQVLRSPTIVGARQVSSVPDKRLLVLTLRIFGTTKADLDANVQTWLDVFSQTNYHTTITIDGVATEWACDDADYELVPGTDGEGVDKIGLMKATPRQVWQFRIPTDPYPTAGVF